MDDEQPVLDVLGEVMQLAGYEATTVSEEEEALKAVQDKAYDLAIVDLQLRRLSGIDLMKKLRCFLRDVPVIILTGYGTIESAVEAMKQGAYSYLTKPIAPRDLRDHIEKALEDRRVTAEIERLKALLEEEYGSAVIVARSDAMQRVLDVVSRVAQSDSTVYIHGESGTGKELIARTIHLASRRKERSFVALNCAALPETLLESTLFGHERGAFTGALQSKKGMFAQAHQGTMFLDEIGDMSLEIQAKVLRVLQERRFYPLGSEKLVEVDLRVIVATNKDLEEEARKGLFRSDLFYRIHVIPIHLPPLRERKEDIPLLVDYFLGRLGRQMKKEIRGLSPSAMRKLMLHDWPGNVRELGERARVRGSRDQKGCDHGRPRPRGPSVSDGGEAEAPERGEGCLRKGIPHQAPSGLPRQRERSCGSRRQGENRLLQPPEKARPRPRGFQVILAPGAPRVT